MSVSTWLRTMRDVPAQPSAPITRMSTLSLPSGQLSALRPSRLAITIAVGMNGITSTQSSIAMRMRSTQPPK